MLCGTLIEGPLAVDFRGLMRDGHRGQLPGSPYLPMKSFPLELHRRAPIDRALSDGLRVCAWVGLCHVACAQSDNFDDGNDTGWLHYSPLTEFGAGAAFTFPNGGYQIAAPGSPAPDLLGVQRAGSLRPETIYTRLRASVEIEGWDNGVNQSLGLIARVSKLGLGTTQAYTYNYNTFSGYHQLNLVANEAPEREVNESPFKIDPTQRYRLVFTLVGAKLLGQMYATTNQSIPIHSVFGEDDRHASGTSGVFAFALVAQGGVGARFDNYSSVVPETVRATVLDAFPAVGERRETPIETVSVRLASMETAVNPESIRLEVNGEAVATDLEEFAPLYVVTHSLTSPLNPAASHRAKIQFADEKGVQVFEWVFGAPEPVAARVVLLGSVEPAGPYSVETGAVLDPGGTRFTVPVPQGARYYRLSDGTERVINSTSVTARGLQIEFR